MPRCAFALAVLTLAGWMSAFGPGGRPAAGAAQGRAQPPPAHLRIDSGFVGPDGGRFVWRGISAFRLAEFVARGRISEVEAYLDWAASQRLTVVRVFAMAHHLFRLGPDEGRAALPTLLDLAAARSLHVEIVALVDTAEIEVDLDAHVRAVGEIAARHPNALVEMANEPGHPTQRSAVHGPERLRALAALVPERVPVALGSVEYGSELAAGDYVTFHPPRDAGDGGWGHVLRLADGAGLLTRFGKPVVSDEPIGAGPRFVAGRRDDSPARFAAAAALTRLAGIHPTFHYEGGLHAVRPVGRELECFEAWTRGLDLTAGVPDDRGDFFAADRLGSLAQVGGARAAFGRVAGDDGWVLAVDPAEEVSIAWAPPWRGADVLSAPGVRLFRGRRR